MQRFQQFPCFNSIASICRIGSICSTAGCFNSFDCFDCFDYFDYFNYFNWSNGWRWLFIPLYQTNGAWLGRGIYELLIPAELFHTDFRNELIEHHFKDIDALARPILQLDRIDIDLGFPVGIGF